MSDYLRATERSKIAEEADKFASGGLFSPDANCEYDKVRVAVMTPGHCHRPLFPC